jgi:glycosyltransferase involved in cell wall biosynthesis
MSHEEAKRQYARADLMIDQIRLGWYGGVAVEAMRMGIPVAVYINPADLVFVPRDMRDAIPEAFLEVNPQNIFDRIAGLLDSPGEYARLSAAAYEYVNTFHDPDKLIGLVINKYQEFCQ